MGLVLDYIRKHSDGRVETYDTVKYTIDDSVQDIFGEFEDHQDFNIPKSKAVYAEDHPSKDVQYHAIDIEEIVSKHNDSPLTYFLDGSRHVYKASDVIINGVVYPVVAGQIVVGCCKRVDREMQPAEIGECRKLILVLPKTYDADNYGEPFLQKKCLEINEELRIQAGINAIQFDEIKCYRIDGDIEEGRNKYLHQAITVVQNEMMDQERIMVGNLCEQKHINKDAWLVKDGTLEYRHSFTNRPDQNLDIAQFQNSLRYVIGVSKLFNPELLNYQEPKIGRIIAELKPFSRTNAYLFRHEKKNYCVWYLRLRNTPNRATRNADVIKVEMMINEGQVLNTSLINIISAHLINEAFPVCYGKDARWANHLYPVYLTELFCKKKYIYDEKIIKVI